MRPLAAKRGLTMNIPPRPSRSRRALETACFAADHDRFADVHLALFRAYFEDGQDIADLEVLGAIVEAAGLDRDALREALESHTYAPRVDADTQQAVALGIRAVPAMLVAAASHGLEAAEPVVGAVPYDWLEDAITRAMAGDTSYAELRKRMRADLRVIDEP